MRLPRLALAAVPALLLVSAACSDNGSATSDSAKRIASQTPQSAQTAAPPTPATTPTPTVDPNGLGPAPVLGGNVLSISPQHGAKVSQANTRTTNPQRPGGLCIQVSYDGLPENNQWFRVAFDGKEVTQQLVLIVASTNSPTGGTMCYSPPEGFTVGRHSAAVAVQDPKNPTAPTRQVVSWKFDVTP